MPGSVASASESLRDSASSANVETILRPGQEDGIQDERVFSHGAMGVMYTVCKEKGKYGLAFIAFRLFIDWWQLWLLVVQPPHFNLPTGKLWWQVLGFITLNQFMNARGYQFFLACFYLLVSGLLLSVGLSVWVGISFQQNRFEHVWPIVLLRWFSKVFYQMLDVMSLSLFLMAMDCQMFFRPENVIGYNQEFPEVYCWSMPHLVHVFVAAGASLMFIFMAGLFTVGEMELDFTTKNTLAIMHTKVELHTFIIRVLMTLVSVFVYNPKWASASQLFLSSYLTYIMWYWQPQLEGWVNHVRTGMYCSVAWCSALYVILAFNLGWDASIPSEDQFSMKAITIVMWVTTIPVGLLGAGLSWMRLKYLTTTVLDKFRQPIPQHSDDAYEFIDSRFVEVLARCCRVWVDRRTLHPDAVVLAETVLKVGLTQLPKDPFMVILYSSFLMDVQSSYQSGYAQLQVAKKLDAGALMRFAIFSREQQHAQRSAAGGLGSKAADLVSYVEFQRNHRMVLRVHRETLNHMKKFWEALLHKQVEFKTLSETVEAMDDSIRQSDRVYKQVLARHATSVKIVRLYGKFLEDVKQDPWAAARWFSEAERLEALEEEERHHDTLGVLEIGDPALRAALLQAGPMGGSAGDSRAIVIINAQSIISITNQGAHAMLGYTKNELKGKNIRLLLPPIIADAHSGFVRNYIQTGEEHVMNHTTEQLVMHKDKRLLPVKLTVSKISGIAEDTLFMGVLEAIPTPPDAATLRVMVDGTILTADPIFEDWLGYSVKELQAQSILGLIVQGGPRLDKELKRARAAASNEHQKDMLSRAISSTGPFKSQTTAHQDERSSVQSGLNPPAPGAALEPPGGSKAAEPSPEPALGSEVLLPEDLPGSALLQLSDTPVMEYGWTVKGVHVAHKYGSPCEVDVHVMNAGAGSLRFHVLTLTRPRASSAVTPVGIAFKPNRRSSLQMMQAPDIPQDLMMVVNSKGQLLHVTSAFAELLGRSKHQALTGLGWNSLDSLMVKPFGQMHRAMLQGVHATAPPAFSCRSGLSVLLQGQGAQGQASQQPFRLSIRKKQGPEDSLFVVLLQARSMDEALDERRLLIELDESGVVVAVPSVCPATLFGCEPERLIGKHVGSFLDILKPTTPEDGAAAGGVEAEISEQRAFEVLMGMASASLDGSCSTWRCGFVLPDSGAEGLQSVAAAKVKGMLSSKPKPALMRLTVHMADNVTNPGEMSVTFEMELWRADLFTSVIEINRDGIIQPPEMQEVAQLYPADLILGSRLEDMQDQHISAFLAPLADKPLVDLFAPGAFGSALPPIDVKRTSNQKRSALKPSAAALSHGMSSGASPSHDLQILHMGDQAPLQISVQAVNKVGGGGGMYLVVHSIRPNSGRPDFGDWMLRQHQSDLTPKQRLSEFVSLRRNSATSQNAGRRSFKTPQPPSQPQVSAQTSFRRGISTPEWQQVGLEVPETSAHVSAAGSNPDNESDTASKAFKLPRSDSLALSNKKKTDAELDAPSKAPAQHAPAADGGRVMNWVQHHSIPAVDVEAEKEQYARGAPGERRANHLAAGGGIGWADQPEVLRRQGSSDLDHQNSLDRSPDDADQAQVDIADDAAAQNETVDASDYKRGQRFKKLNMLLSNVKIQSAVTVYRKHAFLLTGLTLVIKLATFVVMDLLLRNQEVMIQDLTRIGAAGVASTDIAVLTRTLNMIYANMLYPSLRLMSSPDDLPYTLQLYKQHITEFNELHTGFFLGFNQPRKLPDKFGLRELWEEELFPVVDTAVIQFNQSLGNFTTMRLSRNHRNISLWEAGNTLSQKAASLSQNAAAYNLSLNGSLMEFALNTDLMWIVENAPSTVFQGYLQTLDAYLELVVDEAKANNLIQMVLLVLEGVLACAVISTWMYLLLKRVAEQRHKIYHMFMVVPIGLLRRLATKQYLLGDEDEGEEGEGGGTSKPSLESTRQNSIKMPDEPAGGTKASKVVIHIKTHGATAPGLTTSTGSAPASFLSRALSLLMAFFGKTQKAGQPPETKRVLVKCFRKTAWLLWPFIAWGALVILGNLIAYSLMSTIPGPVALFNLVNYVQLLYNSNNFFLQELTYEPDPARMDMHRNTATTRIEELSKQYHVLLYGGQAMPNETAPHYTLVTKGLAYSGQAGAEIMYHTTACLCTNQSECHPPTSHLYTDTRQGLDRLIQKYIEIGEYIKEFQYLDPYLNGPEYDFYWNTQPDISGGFQRLTHAYQVFVVSNLGYVQMLHVVIFALTVVLMVGYVMAMLLPFLKVTKNETRRIAELLSQLPTEVDVAAIVQQVLLPPDPQEETVAQDGPAQANA